MKKIIQAFCLIPSLIWGVTFESDQMEDVLPYIGAETWVLIDVDNTLIESSMHLGSVQWRSHIREKVRDIGYSALESEFVLDKFWLFVQLFIPVRLVDPKAPVLIQNLLKSKIPVLALTARDLIELEHTQRQIDSVGIILSNDFPEKFLLPAAHPALYERGVIYCGENPKSEALVAFFQGVGCRPKKAIFVDDRWEQVKKLEVELEKLGIEFVGMRFSGADERVKSFDPMIADLQFSQLPRIVSDEEAKQSLSDTQVI
jgi:hypothetical protein